MAEMDAFERRVADTLLWYADEAAPAIDAAAVAGRAAFGHPRRAGSGLLRWHPVAMPRVAWLLLLAGLLLAFLAALLMTGARHRDPTPTRTGELVGKWAQLSGDAQVSLLVVGDCVAGATCGSVRVADGAACDYPLVYRSGSALSAVFEVGETTSAMVRCGWSPYPTSTMRLRLAETGSLAMTLSHSGVERASATMYRVVDEQLPELLVGTWGAGRTVPDRVMLALTSCEVGAACGTYRVREMCEYDLTYLRPSGDAFVFWVGGGKTFGCSYGQPGPELRVAPLGENTVSVALRRGEGWDDGVELPRAGTALPLPGPTGTEASGAARAPALDVVADTIGDANAGLDIRIVRTRSTLAGDLVLEVDLNHQPNDANGWSLQAWLDTDGQGSCDPRVSAWVLTVGGGPGESLLSADLVYQPRTDGGSWFGTQGRTEPARYDDLDYLIDDERITVVIPLADLGDPHVLGFRMATAVGVPATVTDTFEDVSRDDLCHEVALEPG